MVEGEGNAKGKQPGSAGAGEVRKSGLFRIHLIHAHFTDCQDDHAEEGKEGGGSAFSLSSRGFAFALKPGFPSDEERKEEPIKACFRPVQKTVESVRSRG